MKTNLMMKDTIKFYDRFIETITPTLNNHGFVFSKSSKSFKKKFELGEYIFEVESLSNGIEVLPSFGVKLPILKRILLKEVYGLDRTTSNIPTIHWRGSHLISNYNDIRLFITDEKEVINAKQKILSFFQNYALPYFEKYSDIVAIDHLLNDTVNEFSSRTHSTEWDDSLYLGLITAKLLARKDYQEVERRNLEKISPIRKNEIKDNMDRFNNIDFETYRNLLGIQ